MSDAFTKPTCKEVIEEFLEHKKTVLPTEAVKTYSGILSFLRMCLHTHAELNPEELAHFRSFRAPGGPYERTVAELFGPDKIEGVVFYYMRRFYKSGRVHCGEETTRHVPAVMAEFCDWLFQRGYVSAPIVEPFKKYQRAMKRDDTERRKGRVPLSDRPPKPPWPEEDPALAREAFARHMRLNELEDDIEIERLQDPWSDGPRH